LGKLRPNRSFKKPPRKANIEADVQSNWVAFNLPIFSNANREAGYRDGHSAGYVDACHTVKNDAQHVLADRNAVLQSGISQEENEKYC
jgi:hypothetical protein